MAVICGGWLAVALVFVWLTNYAFPNPIWTWRFRRINNADHAGPLLEGLMVLFLLLAVYLIGGFVYPIASQKAFSQFILAWPGVVIAAVVLLATSFVNLYVTPNSLRRDFQDKTLENAYQQFRNLGRDEFDAHFKTVRFRVEPVYIPVCFTLVSTLLITIVLLVFGVRSDLAVSGADRERLTTTVEDFLKFQDDRSVMEPEVLAVGEMLTANYAVLTNHTINAYEKYVGITAIFFGLGLWFIGTGYQRVYTEAVAGGMRLGASIIIFGVLPIILVTGYARLVSAASDIDGALTRVSIAALEDDRLECVARSGVGIQDNAPVPTDCSDYTEWLVAFNELRARFDDQVSGTNFFTRMASSWGGAGFILWIAIGFISERRRMFLKSMLPAFPKQLGKVVDAMFTAERKESGKATES
jgi:hypothetical protein